MKENADKINSRLMQHAEPASCVVYSARLSQYYEVLTNFSQDRDVGSEVRGFRILCHRDSHVSFVREEFVS